MMTLNEFIRFNKSKGLHWFDPDAMRFFRCRISNWDCITGYFISSEQGPYLPRGYSIRKANFYTGNVETIGRFQDYKTLSQAKYALNKLLRGQDQWNSKPKEDNQ